MSCATATAPASPRARPRRSTIAAAASRLSAADTDAEKILFNAAAGLMIRGTRKARATLARRPNYGQERAERSRKKEARREERLAAKAERRDKHRPADGAEGEAAAPAPESSGANIPADAGAMRRLAQALAFVCRPDHPATLAVGRAATTGEADDVARARAMFLQLPAREQRAALGIAEAASPSRA